MKVRQAALAGQWYSGHSKDLQLSIEKYLQSSPQLVPSDSSIRALVVPHAGHFWSGPTAAVGYRALNPAQYRRIFILCPNHRMPVHGTASVSVDAFETPLGQLKVDKSVIRRWEKLGVIRIHDAPHTEEHAIEIQLPFIQTVFKDNPPVIVPLIVGEMTPYDVQRLGDAFRNELNDDDLVIVSTDLMHYGENYGYVPFGAPVLSQIRAYDAHTISAIAALNSEKFESYARRTPHAACGLNALRVFSYVFENRQLKGVELAYDTSGRRSENEDMSVSYVAMAVVPQETTITANPNTIHLPEAMPEPVPLAKVISFDSNPEDLDGTTPLSKHEKDYAYQIVRLALEAAVDEQEITPYDVDENVYGSMPEIFQQSYGVFVTLNNINGNLRGCIGNILPVAPLAQSLWGRAQDAALNDPRFDPVTPEEFATLVFEISILTPPRPIESLKEIVIGKHGIIFKKGPWTSVFLPQVAPEQGWNLEQTLNALARKAGLPPNAWREGASFSVFEAQVF